MLVCILNFNVICTAIYARIIYVYAAAVYHVWYVMYILYMLFYFVLYNDVIVVS